MLDNNERILTANRLKIYKRNRKINLFLSSIMLFMFLFLNKKSFYGELVVFFILVVVSWFSYLILTKQSTHQLKKQELQKGKRDSKKILDSARTKKVY